ncbi:hypothetical protein TWF694_009314 [Orbilia ellipsospora]|uniref:Uncharacterized protein n=1 Tax=Orbilia ellipsospora TaxID=2528407 RepID=A0AAV9XF43_9PEZI
MDNNGCGRTNVWVLNTSATGPFFPGAEISMLVHGSRRKSTWAELPPFSGSGGSLDVNGEEKGNREKRKSLEEAPSTGAPWTPGQHSGNLGHNPPWCVQQE